jgi:hypothetical protein
MDIKYEKKVSPITEEHWRRKFNRAIYILLDCGVKSHELIEMIKTIEHDKSSET